MIEINVEKTAVKDVMPILYDYKTGNIIRNATEAELQQSIEAAKHDGGAGVIKVEQVSCYVIE